jgi:hypothetical protein
MLCGSVVSWFCIAWRLVCESVRMPIHLSFCSCLRLLLVEPCAGLRTKGPHQQDLREIDLGDLGWPHH